MDKVTYIIDKSKELQYYYAGLIGTDKKRQVGDILLPDCLDIWTQDADVTNLVGTTCVNISSIFDAEDYIKATDILTRKISIVRHRFPARYYYAVLSNRMGYGFVEDEIILIDPVVVL